MWLHSIKAERAQANTLQKQQWQNLKGAYTSSQKQAQEPEVRRVKLFTTKNKNHPPNGEKTFSNDRASGMERKDYNFFCAPPSFNPCFLLMNFCSFNTWTLLLAASLGRKSQRCLLLTSCSYYMCQLNIQKRATLPNSFNSLMSYLNKLVSLEARVRMTKKSIILWDRWALSPG